MNLKLLSFLFLFFGIATAQSTFGKSKKPIVYELKIYFVDSKEQENAVEQYLKTAFLPAMHRLGIKTVGVFKPEDITLGRRIYVLLPHKSMKRYAEIPAKLEEDQIHSETGKEYLNAAHNKAPYKRIETVLLTAFSHMPALQVPPLKNAKEKRVYELRSYEGATEKIFKNKVHMFNEGGEVSIFNKLGFNAVFYGEVIAGSRMPNLMYMTSFEDKASRDEHWNAFGIDPDWKKLSADPGYKNNVSKIDITFLKATDYSDI